ncbi:hypothetical protein Igag_0693 [Ignisphaera aggregans DSM 17230]|uniref:Uncharacterized protein n=1 Tax=Ignisphaera aggregans (strain DSM 17230 / JCM 13409 / AQ1.S1) TaxID=583356 RepID=E0SSX3_IGNAA|nr:hypothetical protein Igag_0693 [Ignisphaera aggregans DSM 17230]
MLQDATKMRILSLAFALERGVLAYMSTRSLYDAYWTVMNKLEDGGDEDLKNLVRVHWGDIAERIKAIAATAWKIFDELVELEIGRIKEVMRKILISEILRYVDSYDIARDINRALTKIAEEFGSKILKAVSDECEKLAEELIKKAEEKPQPP